MAIVWNKELYDLAYSKVVEPNGFNPQARGPIRLHYHRCVWYPEAVRRATFFKNHFNLSSSTAVLIIGCGFGWTVEALNELGVPAIGTETSAYVQGQKGANEDAELVEAIERVGLLSAAGEGKILLSNFRGDGVRTRANILNEDSSSNASRNRVRSALSSGTLSLCITEDVVTSLTDSECATLRSQANSYSVPIAHFLTENANTSAPFFFNSKSLTGWKALFPSDTVIADGAPYRVL